MGVSIIVKLSYRMGNGDIGNDLKERRLCLVIRNIIEATSIYFFLNTNLNIKKYGEETIGRINV